MTRLFLKKISLFNSRINNYFTYIEVISDSVFDDLMNIVRSTFYCFYAYILNVKFL